MTAMNRLSIALILAAGPVMAAGEGAGDSPGYGWVSLFNSNFVVLIGFLLFLAILFYFNVPAMVMGLLDKRAAGIQADLDEARALREEAQTILASYERKQREVAAQSERIVAAAKADAVAAAKQAKVDLKASIARRLQAAEEQIASAEQGAVREVRDRAVEVAIAAAAKVIAGGTSAAAANALINASITQVEQRLH
jgi:F-type H+-transporting ATPase subunit b